MKYKIITSEKQYYKYCKTLEDLVFDKQQTKQIKEEIALLNLLIKKWDDEHTIFDELTPIELLKSLLKDHKMKAYQLAELLEVSEGLVSDMLSYKKGLSKESIRILASHFKLNQEALNRPYKLKSGPNNRVKNTASLFKQKERG